MERGSENDSRCAETKFSDQMHLQVEVQVHQLQAQVLVQVVLAGRCKYEQQGRAG